MKVGWRDRRDGEDVEFDLATAASSEQVDILTRASALQELLVRRPSWSGREIRQFLLGVRKRAVRHNDVVTAHLSTIRCTIKLGIGVIHE